MTDVHRWFLAFSLISLAAFRFFTQDEPSLGVQSWFHRCDLDGSGEISEQEYEMLSSPLDDFSLHDSDGSGGIDLYEFEAKIRALNPEWIMQEPG